MLAARDQENLTFSHQHGAAIKQQQGHAKTPGARYPKTPLKVPLNDENGTLAKGGAKNLLTRGNENAMTAKKLKGTEKSTNFMTPAEARGARAVLGDKTTNAKARGLQSVNVKSAVREIEKSQAKLQKTVSRKRPNEAEPTQKLQVHVEEASEAQVEKEDDNQVEYCPPRPKDIPYESDVFPEGHISFDALKPENLFKGYYRHYFNPVDENGVSLATKELAEKTKKVIEEGDRKIREDIKNMDWGLSDELGTGAENVKAVTNTKGTLRNARIGPTARRPLSSIRSRHAANALSMDDTTKSLQRTALPTKTPELNRSRPITHKKPASVAVPSLRTAPRPLQQSSAIPKKSPAGLEANSRTTIGYNKGRATASALHSKTSTTTTSTGTIRQPTIKTPAPRQGPSTSTFKRSDTTLSNASDKTITPARFARNQKAAEAEDQAWKECVPFLSIFNPEDYLIDSDDQVEEEDDDPLGIKGANLLIDDDDETFEMKLNL
ncbi:hypothetical protein F5Y16DRAFT_405803 [Xylariaceae sp. FL0255]|nr:hypothetical protein F5Y16DRAFT_405803 [Xylariaceae sp. FL0255]